MYEVSLFLGSKSIDEWNNTDMIWEGKHKQFCIIIPLNNNVHNRTGTRAEIISLKQIKIPGMNQKP